MQKVITFLEYKEPRMEYSKEVIKTHSGTTMEVIHRENKPYTIKDTVKEDDMIKQRIVTPSGSNIVVLKRDEESTERTAGDAKLEESIPPFVMVQIVMISVLACVLLKIACNSLLGLWGREAFLRNTFPVTILCAAIACFGAHQMMFRKVNKIPAVLFGSAFFAIILLTAAGL